MKSADEMKRLFNIAAVQTNAAPDDAVFETLKTAYTRTVQHKSAQREPSMWRLVMKSPLTKLAAAAVVVIACLIGLSVWRTTGSGIALADVLARMEQAKAYRFQWSRKVTREDPNKPYSSERATMLISQEYGWKDKTETLDPNGGESTFDEAYVLLQKKTIIKIIPKEKKYFRVEFDDRGSELLQGIEPLAILKEILESKHESLGRSTIDGIEVEGFQATDPNFTTGVVKMWADVKTRLPVRYDGTFVSFDQIGDKIIKREHFVMHDFQWDVTVAAADFEPPPIPDDYTGTVIKYPAHIGEETAIQGLKLLVEYLGKYPEKITGDLDDTVLRLGEKSETPAALRFKEEIKGLTDEEINNKLVDFLVPIRGAALFYLRLERDKQDRAYYGKTVTPKDADKVLMRWKVSNNEYRVIFGDLHAETVSPERLAELEKLVAK